MKNVFYVILAVTMIAALGACATEDRDEANDFGENMMNEGSILAATWNPGETVVVKDGDRYKVSGKITLDPDYSGVYCVKLIMRADPDDANKYFSMVKRYTITIDFPDSSVKPLPAFGEGFHLYFENIKTTENNTLGDGSWQSEPVEEYSAIGGVGTMKVDRNLAEGLNTITNKNNVGDYQQLVISVRFAATHEGKDYSFYISNVGVYCEGISSAYPGEAGSEIPKVHENSRLNDAVYAAGEPAEPLRVVPAFQGGQDVRHLYTHQWFSNTADSYEGAVPISEAMVEEDFYDNPPFGGNADHPAGWNAGTKFTPPTDVAGTYYYYDVMTWEGNSTATRIVKIVVTE